MKNNYFLITFISPIAFAFIFFIASLIYIPSISKIYESNSTVTLLRPLIENPGQQLPELRNRWVWLRDGLDIKSHILSEKFIINVIYSSPELLKVYNIPLELETFKEHDIIILNQLKNNISITYSGPDDNLYSIKVKNINKQRALLINEQILKQFKFYISTKYEQVYNTFIKKLNSNITRMKNTDDKSYAHNILRQVKITALSIKISSQNSFILSQSPKSSLKMTWPNKNFIMLAFILLGLTFGFIVKIFYIRSK